MTRGDGVGVSPNAETPVQSLYPGRLVAFQQLSFSDEVNSVISLTGQ